MEKAETCDVAVIGAGPAGAFRACVAAWYNGRLQRIIFDRPMSDTKVTAYITSILAGYAWDQSNPAVREPDRFLRLVDELCVQQ